MRTDINSQDQTDIACFKSWSRIMLKRYPFMEVLSMLQESYEEASDEQWFFNKYPEEIFNKEFIGIKEKRIRKVSSNSNTITSKIVSKISIIETAEKYGIKVHGNKAICPFHADKDPSLSFNDKKGLFNCFGSGCGAHGNIVDFIYLIKKQKGEINE